ncbi:MAG: hypothetical protein ABI947_09360 [Chloroflexota bacterium]
MAHIVNPYNLDDDDDAVFSALLSQGLIWVDDDDNEDGEEPEIEELESSNEIKVRTLRGHTASVNSVAVSGDFVISASSDKTLRVWNWKTGQHLRTLSGHTNSVNEVVVSDDFAISASSDKTLRVWNWKTGQHLRTLSGYTHELSAVGLEGNVVASAAFGEIWVWNWQTGEFLRKLSGWHSNDIRLVAVDGDFVLSSSTDLILVRNWKTGTILHKIRAENDSRGELDDLAVNRNFAIFLNFDPIDVWNWKTGEHLDKSALRNNKNVHIDKKVFLTPSNLYVYSREIDQWSLYNLDSLAFDNAHALAEDYLHIITGDNGGAIHIIRINPSLQRLIAGKTVTSSITSRGNELPNTTKPKHEGAAKAVHDYDGNDVLQAAHDFIHKRDEEWVNFSRLSHHLYETFGKLNFKHLERPNKKYRSLLKFFVDYPSKFDLRQDDEKSGLYWIRLKRTH